MSKSVNETDIINLVGLETYQALSYLFPKLFNTRYINKQIKDYYIQLVQGVMVSSGLTSQDLKLQLVEYILNPNENSPIIPLVNSSFREVNLPNTFMENAFWFLMVGLISTVLIFIIVRYFDETFI